MTIDERTKATEAPVMMTDTAAAKVREMIEEQDETGLVLRLMAIPGGCAGFRYDLHFDTRVDASDTVTEHGEVKLVVDEDSVPRLVGATIDYREEGLKGSGFAIENPNETGHQCTCGKR
jgi:iron-sulfur cluster insertion protein